MKTDYDDSNWREESIPYYTGTREKLLKEGPKSLSQSWILGAMYNEWKRRNGYKDPEQAKSKENWREMMKRNMETLHYSGCIDSFERFISKLNLSDSNN